MSSALCCLAISLCLGTTGCGSDSEIADYVVNRELEPGLSSELLRSQFPPIPFRWEVPDSWSVAANDQFSQRAWNVGPPGDQGRVTLGKFPASSGIPAQVLRWRRQLGLEAAGMDEAMENVSPVETKNQSGSWVSVDGRRETIRAMILTIGSDFWIFRYRSSLETAKQAADGFRAFCESVEYVPMTDDAGSEFGGSPESAAEDKGE